MSAESNKQSDKTTAESTQADSAEQDTRTPDEIRHDIDQTRDELGDTVEQLAAKTDVKGQAKQRVEDAKQTVRQKREEFTTKAKDTANNTTPESAKQSGQQVMAKVRENPAPVAIGGAVLAGFLIGRITSR